MIFLYILIKVELAKIQAGVSCIMRLGLKTLLACSVFLAVVRFIAVATHEASVQREYDIDRNVSRRTHRAAPVDFVSKTRSLFLTMLELV